MNLTQAEADLLLSMEKHCLDDKRWRFPVGGGRTEIPLVSPDGRENFTLDLQRGKRNMAKLKYQNRSRQTIILARLELNGGGHRNPDDLFVPCPHIHLYREGYGDKWAFPVNASAFNDLSNPSVVLDDFMRYCNITRQPEVDMVLF